MNKKIQILFISCIISLLPFQKAIAQDNSAHLDSLIDSLFNDSEQNSYFRLIDSLLNAPVKMQSEWMLKLSYLSKISTLGRDMGIYQYGFSPGIAYFHKSGFYGDITGYWNSGDSVDLNYTMFTLGYMQEVGDLYGFILSYDYSKYSTDGYNLNHSFGILNYLSFNHLDLGMDYSYLFGSETAHRLNFHLSGYFPIKNVKIFDRIIFSPKFSAMFGTSNVVNEQFTIDQIRRYSPTSGSGGTQNGKNRLPRNINSEFYDAKSGKVFGLMNYNFSLPVKFKIKKFSLTFHYNYNIPVALPGEDVDFPNYSYYSVSTSYRIAMGK